MPKIENYLNTSVDDCRTSLNFISDLEFLRQLLEACEQRGHTSRARVVRSRIRKVERCLDMSASNYGRTVI